MPRFLEAILQKEYGKDSKIPYKVMNAKGYMRGNQPTTKGEALQATHDRDQATQARQVNHKLRHEGARG
jgi:hypothetical protein